MSGKYYKDQLGLTHTTADLRLKKKLLYSFAERLGLLRCYRCSESIDDINDFTIDHKREWRNVDASLFWDLENVAFSHSKCNTGANRTASFYKNRTEKQCNECRAFKPLNSFQSNGHRNGGNQYRSYCTPCRNKRKREGKSY